MAQRYGGKFSPRPETKRPETKAGVQSDARGTFEGAKRTRAGGRVNLLFIAPLPLIWHAFGNGPVVMAMSIAALGLLLLAAWLTREGLFAQEAYEARKVARKPGFPRKMAGSVLTGLGLALAAFADAGGVIAPLIYLLIGTLLHSFAFGLDPLKDKGMAGVDLFQTDRVARAVEEAEKHLIAMKDAARRAGDRKVETRVEQFQRTARDLFRTVEEDPRDLSAARKYLSVYLLGARDATVKFADIYSRNRDAEAREGFLTLLDDLEQNFAARTEKLLLDDRNDLNIEIDVLRERLQREGVSPDKHK